MSADPNRLLASLAQSQVAIDLKTLDIVFLAALKLRGGHGALASFPEDELLDVFEQVASAVDPAAETRARATPTLRRMREQRMLARVDGAGVVRAGEYALTRLAIGIVEFVLEDETLTRESLTVLTRTLLASLQTIRADAERAQDADRWASAVTAPLRVAVGELVAGIQRRQRGFDLEQEQLRREMAGLLQADWSGAVERCQTMLETTTATLRELCQILLRDAQELHGVLHQIQELALEAHAEEAEAAARAVAENVDRVVAWGTARQKAWSEHYQYVHRFLRDVVLLDPSRALTQRLRESMASGAGRRYALSVASAPPILLLRDVVPPPKERPPVRRRKAEPEAPLEGVLADDPEARLEGEVRAAIAQGARALGAITDRLAIGLPEGERFVAAGRIAAAVARITRADGAAERPWSPVADALLVEDWALEGER